VRPTRGGAGAGRKTCDQARVVVRRSAHLLLGCAGSVVLVSSLSLLPSLCAHSTHHIHIQQARAPHDTSHALVGIAMSTASARLVACKVTRRPALVHGRIASLSVTTSRTRATHNFRHTNTIRTTCNSRLGREPWHRDRAGVDTLTVQQRQHAVARANLRPLIIMMKVYTTSHIHTAANLSVPGMNASAVISAS
jgi:hypothetical protein